MYTLSNTTEDYIFTTPPSLTTPLSLTISGLASGEESCFSIEAIDDNLFEDPEDFTVHLSTDDASVIISAVYATVTITDNDGMSSIISYFCSHALQHSLVKCFTLHHDLLGMFYTFSNSTISFSSPSCDWSRRVAIHSVGI